MERTTGYLPVPWSTQDHVHGEEPPVDDTPAEGPYCPSKFRGYECTMRPDHTGVTHRAGTGRIITAEWTDTDTDTDTEV